MAPPIINILVFIAVLTVVLVVVGGGSGVLDILSVIGITKETKKINKFENTFEEFAEVVEETVIDIQTQLDECCELQNEILAEQQKTGCDLTGHLEETTGCRYSSKKMLETKQAIEFYWERHITPAYMLINKGNGFEWSSFVSGVQDYRYANTSAKKAAYPALQDGTALLMQIDAAAALPQTTPRERAQLKLVRQEVLFTRDLYDRNFIHSEYDGFWNQHPALDDYQFALILPSFSGESDYDTKILLYMQRLYASKLRAVAFYNDILTGDTPPQVETEYSCLLWGDLVSFVASPGLRDDICNGVSNPGLQTLCFTLAANIETAAAQVDAIYNGAYCAAAATYRPLSKPGLSNVHFGNETYLIWLKYMSGIDMAIDQRLEYALTNITQGISDAEIELDAAYPGMTFADFLDQYNDPTNPRFLACFNTLQEVTRFFEAADNNVSRAITPEFQYLPRAPFAVQSADECCFYNDGTYDPYTNLWSAPGRFRFGPKLLYNGTMCVDRYAHSMTTHEGRGGHHMHSSHELQLKCEIDPNWTFFSGYAEGWAAYSELQCNKTTLCDDHNERVYNLFWTTYGTGGVLRGDILLNGGSATFAECVASYTSVAAAPYAEKFCQRSMNWPGQLAGYLQASREFAAARKRAEEALGGLFSAPIFNMLVVKFNRMPWADMHEMVDTYIEWVLDRPAALLKPWGLSIDELLFRSSDVVIGTGFSIPDTGAVLTSSIQTETQQTIAALAISNPLFGGWYNSTLGLRNRKLSRS